MNATNHIHNGKSRWSLVAGLVLLLLFGFQIGGLDFKRAYLYGYIFWIGLSLGSLGLLLLHNLTGGEWGQLIRRGLEGAVSLMPLMTLLFIPLILFARDLYPWLDPTFPFQDRVSQAKAHYLNMPFFMIRQIFYFGLWNYYARRQLLKTSEGPDRGMSAAGLLLFFVSVTFASIDWMMSLEPRWHSSIYGAMTIVGFGLATFSFLIIHRTRELRHDAVTTTGHTKAFHDLGNLLLAFVLLWGYMGFSQYLIIWNANLADEAPWYLTRASNGWQYLILGLLTFQLLVPLLLLLFKSNKQNPERLSLIAWLILLLRPIDLIWIIWPAFYPDRLHLSVFLPVGLAVVGTPWMVEFLKNLKTEAA